MTTLLLVLYFVLLPVSIWVSHLIGYTRGERSEFKRIISGAAGLSIGGRAKIVEADTLEPGGDLTASVVFRRDRH